MEASADLLRAEAIPAASPRNSRPLDAAAARRDELKVRGARQITPSHPVPQTHLTGAPRKRFRSNGMNANGMRPTRRAHSLGDLQKFACPMVLQGYRLVRAAHEWVLTVRLAS